MGFIKIAFQEDDVRKAQERSELPENMHHIERL